MKKFVVALCENADYYISLYVVEAEDRLQAMKKVMKNEGYEGYEIDETYEPLDTVLEYIMACTAFECGINAIEI